jgi:glycosyltransferase involved in cell wall biosynthesis
MRSVSANRDGAVSHILVFEPDAEGHPREWLEHIVAYVAAEHADIRATFVVAAEMHRHLDACVPSIAGDRISVLALTPAERWLCTRRFLTLAAFARWWIMRRYLRRTGAQAGHFLSFDHMCLPLALGLGTGGKPVSGILFRPSVHYEGIGPYSPSLPERLRDVRKTILYRLMLLNRAVHAVLSLDPYFTPYARHRYRFGAKVRTIGDPTHPSSGTQTAMPGAAAAPANCVGFVFFGYLTERKGVLVLLDALGRIDPGISSRVSVTIAGRVEAALRERVEARIRHLRKVRPELCLRLEDRWIPAAELDAIIATGDVVLAPYQRFVGSSGVLLWAARMGIPVLTQDFGLLGRLVHDHRLGLTADTLDPASLAAGIERMVIEGPDTFVDPGAAQSFAASRTPRAFAAAVVTSLWRDEPRTLGAA